MLQLGGSRIFGIARTNGWWIAPQAIVVAVLSVTQGMWGVWLVYAVFNSLLVWIYADQAGPRSKVKRQIALKVLAIALLPVGFIAMLGSGGPRITDRSGDGAPGEGLRNVRASRPAAGAGLG